MVVLSGLNGARIRTESQRAARSLIVLKDRITTLNIEWPEKLKYCHTEYLGHVLETSEQIRDRMICALDRICSETRGPGLSHGQKGGNGCGYQNCDHQEEDEDYFW